MNFVYWLLGCLSVATVFIVCKLLIACANWKRDVEKFVDKVDCTLNQLELNQNEMNDKINQISANDIVNSNHIKNALQELSIQRTSIDRNIKAINELKKRIDEDED